MTLKMKILRVSFIASTLTMFYLQRCVSNEETVIEQQNELSCSNSLIVLTVYHVSSMFTYHPKEVDIHYTRKTI